MAIMSRVVHQNLVHNHLEEEWGDQDEELQDEGGQQDFAEQLAVYDDGGDELGEVEFSEFAGEQGVEDQLPLQRCR